MDQGAKGLNVENMEETVMINVQENQRAVAEISLRNMYKGECIREYHFVIPYDYLCDLIRNESFIFIKEKDPDAFIRHHSIMQAAEILLSAKKDKMVMAEHISYGGVFEHAYNTFLESASQLFGLPKKCFVSNAAISPVKEAVFNAYFVEHAQKNAFHVLFPKKEKVMDCQGAVERDPFSGQFKWSVNMSSILTRLIKEAALCEAYSSDLFINWSEVEEYMKPPSLTPKIFLFGFRKSGVDHNAFVVNKITKGAADYRALYALEAIPTEGTLKLQFYKIKID